VSHGSDLIEQSVYTVLCFVTEDVGKCDSDYRISYELSVNSHCLVHTRFGEISFLLLISVVLYYISNPDSQ